MEASDLAGASARLPFTIANNGCFGCGKDNPIGLKLHFEPIEAGVRAECRPERQYQGYPGLLHGGLAATLLDEALAWAVLKNFGPAVTAEFYMRHRHPVPTDQKLIVTGRIVRRRLALVECEGEIADEEGLTLVEGRAKFMLVKQAPDMV